ncbi:MAG: hypothetical protein PHC51_01250, partial [bacterium]|nr:hypothetical protein [bacterium]
LENKRLSDQEAKTIDLNLKEKSPEKYSLVIEPFAWLKAFAQTQHSEPGEIKDIIIKALRTRESRLAAERKLPPLGAKALKRQNIFQTHTPKKFGKKMICLGSEKSTRKIFIQFFKDGARKARLAVKQIRLGLDAKLPPSFFHPGGYLLSNILPFFTPLPLG